MTHAAALDHIRDTLRGQEITAGMNGRDVPSFAVVSRGALATLVDGDWHVWPRGVEEAERLRAGRAGEVGVDRTAPQHSGTTAAQTLGLPVENGAASAPAPTPLAIELPRLLTWDTVRQIACDHPQATAVRNFLYMQPGSGFPEVWKLSLHVQSGAFVIVLPLDPLECEVRCDVCRKEYRDLGELCPVCHGEKWRTMTVADVQRFVDAGDRFSMSGSFWRMAALPREA